MESKKFFNKTSIAAISVLIAFAVAVPAWAFVIPSQEEVKSEEAEPYVVLDEVTKISDDTKFYRVLFEVFAGSEDRDQVTVLVFSDLEEYEVTVQDLKQEQSSLEHFVIMSDYPETVNVAIMD